MQDIYSTSQSQLSSIEVSKVLRNTYALLAMTVLFSAFTAFISTSMDPEILTPYSKLRLAAKADFALATRAFVGVQPLFTQVPPNSLRSITAVLSPWAAQRAAIEGPAWPVPIIIAS